MDTKLEFEKRRKLADEMLKHPDEIEDLLKRLEKKLKGVPKLKKELAYIPSMGLLINSFIKKEYTKVPIGSISAMVAAVIYFVAPVDLVPDFIPVAGYLDDVAIVAFALQLVKGDVDEYMEWRKQQGLDDRFTV